jgi:acetyl-CoA carboxylase biotin carboxyl carrier protein
MELKEIKELVQLMGSVDLSEVAVEKGNFKLTLKRELRGDISSHIIPTTATHAPPQPLETPAITATQNPSEAAEGVHFVTAPLVGTLYLSPSPEAGAFVSVGDKIKKGQTLCIVEAMKLMNEIESDVDGTLVEVVCDNATPVEFGSKLFAIKTK